MQIFFKKSGNKEDLVASYVMDTLRQGRADELSEALSKTKSIDESNQALIDNLKASDFGKKSGVVYEVDIPDPVKAKTPTGKNYLEEDTRITSAQYEKFQKAIKAYSPKKTYNDYQANLDYYAWSKQGGGRGLEIRERAEGILGNKDSSKFLQSLGYDGIHYNGGRDGEAYVIFDDNKLEIKKHSKL